MIQSQTFQVNPHGPVKSGNVSYSVDLATGKINYFAQVTVGLWPFSRTVPENPKGVYQVDPLSFLSSRFTRGSVITIGGVTFTVTSLSRSGIATVRAVFSGLGGATGTAAINVSKKYIRLNQLMATVKVPLLGTVMLEVVEVAVTPSWTERIGKLFKGNAK